MTLASTITILVQSFIAFRHRLPLQRPDRLYVARRLSLHVVRRHSDRCLSPSLWKDVQVFEPVWK